VCVCVCVCVCFLKAMCLKYTQPEINVVLTDIFFRSFSFLSSFIHTESKTVHLYVGRKVLDFIYNVYLNERSGKKGIVLLVFLLNTMLFCASCFKALQE
jgi:hypothetical protein